MAFARTAGDRDALAFGLHAAGEAAHAQRRHQLALKHFRELRAVTGISYLAEEIMQLQLLDRYHDAQLLLDAAREDSHASPGAPAPTVLFAQARQLYYLADDLREADRVAASVVELGQLIGTKEQVIEATFIRVFIAVLRGEPRSPRAAFAGVPCSRRGRRRCAPGPPLLPRVVERGPGDTKHGLTLWSQFLAEPAESRSYWAWWPCWMPIMFEGGMACGARDLTETVVAIAEEGAACNPEVATLKGVAVSLRGLFTNDLAMVAESVEILRHCPRLPIRAWGIENYGLMLLHSGERQAGLDQLDQAWDEYDHMGALGRRAAVQRVMRQAGVRRSKWSSDNSGSAARQLTEAERRVVFVIADGHTDKSAAKLLGISENTVGTHIRSAYRKLGVRSRVQLTALR